MSTAKLESEKLELTFTLNGKPCVALVDPEKPLLEILRMEIGLMGTKGACLEGECGSCTVLLDGKAVNSCLVMAGQVQGREVTTIEGLAKNGTLDVVQEKFIETGAAQCGYCTPGLILAAKYFIDSMPDASEDDVISALEGNICRCTGYNKIVEAVRLAYREVHGVTRG
ncbi:MAG: (2Fe-2S)-binding protein [Candidatus Sumerlaeaceae bacterium]|jgi:carbon-monoxide dehydrogenase small subunit